MKIGSVHGTHEEIKDLLENNGLDLDAYLEKPEAPLRDRWIVFPCAGFVCAALVVGVWGMRWPFSPTGLLIAAVLLIAMCAWACVAIQLRFKNTFATTVAAIAGLVILLVTLAGYSVADAANFIRQFKQEQEK